MKSKRIILTGFMGTGKTAVSESLAKRLGYEFLDTDQMVEQERKKAIPEIFQKEGETAFRRYEKKMLQKALEKERVVIAVGGGAVTDPENLRRIKEKGVMIGLAASPEVILQRISRLNNRPLLDTADKLKKIKNLLDRRSPYYREADRIVDTTHRTVEQTIEEILKFLNEDHSR